MRAVCDISIFLVVQAVVTLLSGPTWRRARAHVFGDDEKGGEDNSSHVRRSEKFHPRRRKCSCHERADSEIIRSYATIYSRDLSRFFSLALSLPSCLFFLSFLFLFFFVFVSFLSYFSPFLTRGTELLFHERASTLAKSWKYGARWRSRIYPRYMHSAYVSNRIQKAPNIVLAERTRARARVCACTTSEIRRPHPCDLPFSYACRI